MGRQVRLADAGRVEERDILLTPQGADRPPWPRSSDAVQRLLRTGLLRSAEDCRLMPFTHALTLPQVYGTFGACLKPILKFPKHKFAS